MMIMPLLGKTAAIMGCTVLVVGGIAYSGGVVDVRVDEKTPQGHHIRLPLPALAALAVVEAVPARYFGHGHDARQLQQFAPVIHEVAKELENCPDAVLVDVVDNNETVHIRKEGSYLVVDVDNRHETVHVSFPIRMVSAVLDTVADKTRRAQELQDRAQESEPTGPTV